MYVKIVVKVTCMLKSRSSEMQFSSNLDINGV